MAKVDLHYFTQALACASRQGISPASILKTLDINIPPDALTVDGEQMTRVIQHIWLILEDEFLGCTSTRCKTGSFPFMARHVLHYKQLEQILIQGCLFYKFATDDIQMTLVIKGDLAEFEVRFSTGLQDPEHFFLEFWLIIWHRFASWLIDVKIPLTQVCFPHSQPPHWQKLKQLFPCRHHYNRDVLKLCFSSSYLAKDCVRTAQELNRFLRHSPADLITIPGSDLSYKAKVRSALLYPIGERFVFPSFEEIAMQLNLGTQTLRRRLKVEGTSYPQIKETIRKDMAIEYLLTTNHSVNQISDLLGFSEPRSFTRAFKQWTGKSPSKYASTKNYIY